MSSVGSLQTQRAKYAYEPKNNTVCKKIYRKPAFSLANLFCPTTLASIACDGCKVLLCSDLTISRSHTFLIASRLIKKSIRRWRLRLHYLSWCSRCFSFRKGTPIRSERNARSRAVSKKTSLKKQKTSLSDCLGGGNCREDFWFNIHFFYHVWCSYFIACEMRARADIRVNKFIDSVDEG